MTLCAGCPAADALVVVDVQRALVLGEHAVAGAEDLLLRLAGAVAAARAAGTPVVHLQDEGVQDRLIRKGTEGWTLALPVVSGEPVLPKRRDDGFEGTGLEELLRSVGSTRLCLVGIQSEMCVAATARGAMARGFTVVLPRDAHTTYDAPADGTAPQVPAAHVSRVAEWSLGNGLVAPDHLADVRFEPPAPRPS